MLKSLLTRQVEECVEDIKAICVSTLNKFVGVHLSDVRSVQSENREIHEGSQTRKQSYSYQLPL